MFDFFFLEGFIIYIVLLWDISITTPGVSLDILVLRVALCGDDFILFLTGFITRILTACSRGIYLC